MTKRELLKQAKCKLYHAFLEIENDDFTDSDLSIMKALMVDDQIQAVIAKAFAKGRT